MRRAHRWSKLLNVFILVGPTSSALGFGLLLYVTLISAQTFQTSALATFKPLSLSSTRRITGGGRDVGAWSVAVCSESAIPMTIPRERIMTAAPSLHELPGALAQDVLTRKASADTHSIALRILDGALPILTTGATTYGLAKKIDYATYSGLALTALMLIRAEVARSAPNPTPYFQDLLPASIVLGPLQCSTWGIVAGLAPKVETIGPVHILIP